MKIFNAALASVFALIASSIGVAVTSVADELVFEEGSGSIIVDGGSNREQRKITLFYHMPSNMTAESQVLFVLPGGGRNGDDYRDHWVKTSEKYSVVVLSPSYSDEHYPGFWNYNLGGMVSEPKFNEARTRLTSYSIEIDHTQWIFDDFDRMFMSLKSAMNLSTNTYDLFGHSAGGQLAHRFALFGGRTQVGRILAANSGWYTVPVFDDQFPYGLSGGVITSTELQSAFSKNLIVLAGELDNENETRGQLARSAEIDVQGLGRFSRSQYFFGKAESTAKDIDADFNWTWEMVPGVGHEYKLMGDAAAEILYGKKDE